MKKIIELPPCIIEGLDSFIDHLKVKGYSDVTIYHRRFQLIRFLKYTSRQNINRLQDITPDHITSYANSLIDEKLTATSQENYLYPVKLLFRHLEACAQVFESPATDIHFQRCRSGI